MDSRNGLNGHCSWWNLNYQLSLQLSCGSMGSSESLLRRTILYANQRVQPEASRWRRGEGHITIFMLLCKFDRCEQRNYLIYASLTRYQTLALCDLFAFIYTPVRGASAFFGFLYDFGWVFGLWFFHKCQHKYHLGLLCVTLQRGRCFVGCEEVFPTKKMLWKIVIDFVRQYNKTISVFDRHRKTKLWSDQGEQ